MGGRFLDYMGQGAYADRPLAADMPSRVAPGSAAVYYANDEKIFSFFNESLVEWTELDIDSLGTPAFQSLADVDWTTPPTDGQVFVWDETTSKLLPYTIPGGLSSDEIKDFVGAMFVDATYLAWDYDAVTKTITLTTSLVQYTDEMAQDAVAALIAAGTHVGISFVYDDATSSLSAQVSSAFVDARIAAASIDALVDVDTTTTPPVVGQTLVFDDTDSSWKPGEQGYTLTPAHDFDARVATGNATNYNGGIWFGNFITVDSDGEINSVVYGLNAAEAGINATPVIYADNAGALGAILAQGPTVANGILGDNNLPLTSSLSVTAGESLWVGCYQANTGGITATKTAGDPSKYFIDSLPANDPGSALTAWSERLRIFARGTIIQNNASINDLIDSRFVTMTQAAYDALGTYDADTYYIIIG